MAPIAAAKGGRLDARVLNVEQSTFTIHVTGKGHEHHGKDIALSLDDYNGAGALTGAKHRASDKNPNGYVPKSGPKPGEYVLFDADAHAEEDADLAPRDADLAAAHADSCAQSAKSAADRAEAAAARAEKASAAAATPAGQ